jgi:hypothetical protein
LPLHFAITRGSRDIPLRGGRPQIKDSLNIGIEDR